MRCARPSGSSASSRMTSPPISALQFRGRAQRDDVAVGVNRQTVAALGLFHQMRGDQHGHAFFVAQNLQVLPQVAARAGIESGRRLIEQQHRRMMQQPLRQFQAPLHAAGKCLGFFFRAIGQPNAAKHLGNALLQRRAAQAVDMADDASGSLRPTASRRCSAPGKQRRCCGAPAPARERHRGP